MSCSQVAQEANRQARCQNGQRAGQGYRCKRGAHPVGEIRLRRAGELVTEIGVQGIKDLGVRALKKLPGILSPKEIGEWLTDLGAVSSALAETYTGEALKHYGRNWFKLYKGVTGQTQHHLLVGEFNALGFLQSGCHDKGAFDAVVAAGNAVIDATRTRVNGIYTEFWWRRPNQAPHNLGPKTVVDGLAADWASWADRIRKATRTN